MRSIATALTALTLLGAWHSYAHAQCAPATKRRAVASPYTRYAQSIQAKADSVIHLADQANSAAAGIAATRSDLGPVLSSAGKQMRVLAGDFDAVTPPAEFQRLHEQLVTPLKHLADKFERSAVLLTVDCSAQSRVGESCDEDRLRLEAARAGIVVISSMAADHRDYKDARERAARMLAEHRVTLPDLESHR